MRVLSRLSSSLKLDKLVAIDRIQHVFLTHTHNDHTGFLGELLAKSGAQLVLEAGLRFRIVEIPCASCSS